jgi:formylglycine-generating enzyme required for sulfatase activity
MIVRLSKLPAQRAAAAKQAYEEIFAKPILKNSIGMELKLIPPGSFTMGTGGGVIQKGNPESPHIVEIRKAFYLGIYEVTQSQYEQVTGTNPSELVTGDHPVSNVTWTDAQKFCELLSGSAAEKAAKRSYRLPTEAEWEYACRSGTSSAFSFGKDELLIDDYAWYAGNSRGMNHPTGQKKPNAWGLFDMHGNVLEWCEDLFAEYPSAELVPAPKHRLEIRVLRGGSSNLESIKCRSAIRSAENPTLRSNFIGFRVAMTIGT